MSCDVDEAPLILQPFHHFTYVTTLSATLPPLYLRHSSFSSPSVASPTSQLILQHLFCFSYVTGFSLTSPGELPMLSLAKTCNFLTLILQTFPHFTYVTTHSPTLPSLYLHHSSFSNPSVTSPTPQLIPQPFFCFSYVTGFSLTSPGELPMWELAPANIQVPPTEVTVVYRKAIIMNIWFYDCIQGMQNSWLNR